LAAVVSVVSSICCSWPRIPFGSVRRELFSATVASAAALGLMNAFAQFPPLPFLVRVVRVVRASPVVREVELLLEVLPEASCVCVCCCCCCCSCDCLGRI